MRAKRIEPSKSGKRRKESEALPEVEGSAAEKKEEERISPIFYLLTSI